MKVAIVLALGLATAACQSNADGGVQDGRGAGLANSPVRWPSTLRVIGDGYPKPGDPCRGLGETAAVTNYLDHNDRLLGCPTRADAVRLGGDIVGEEGGIVLVSVPSPGP